jgi:PAS domain S-box-containing protein
MSKLLAVDDDRGVQPMAAVKPCWKRRFRAASAVLSAGVVAIGLVVLVELRGQAAGYDDVRFGVALTTLSTAIALTCFSSIIATSLHRLEPCGLEIETARQRCLEDMQVAWTRLEADVEAMTRLNQHLRDGEQRFRTLVDASAQIVWSTDATGALAATSRERQLREMVENAPYAVAMLDRNMQYVEVSPRWLREYMLGPDVIGKSHYELFPEIPEHWKAVHRRCLAGATEQNDSEPFVRQDGSVQWIRWKICPWRDLQGTIAGILIYSEDITAQREAEDAARATQEQLRLAQRVARIGTFDVNLQTGVNTWTPELEGMYGLPVGEFAGTQAAWEDLVHPDDRAYAVQRVEDAFATGAPTEAEWRVRWPDGSTHWLSGRFQGFRDDAGRPVRLIGVNIEITERKRAEEQRERLLAEIRDLTRNLEARVEERTKEVAVARDRLDGLISMAADAIVAIDDDQRITIFNRGAEKIFGWTREEVLGKPLALLLPEHLRGRHHAQIASFASEPAKGRPMAERSEVLGLRKNGEEFPAEAAISQQRTEGASQFTVILRDITGRRRLADEQARIHVERAVLLKEIHHRVKNNLQVISSLFYLQAQRTEQESVRRLLDESRERLQSIALIHEKLYRSEQLASIDFGDYLRDLTANLTSAIGVQAPHVQVRVEAEEIFLDIDRAIPCALLVNELVSNSMKHAFPGGRHGEIRIAATWPDSGLEVEVSDTGIGFPADLDFQNVTTLGLQLVMSLTKQLRGTVELVRGEGTTFRIRVPARAPVHRIGSTADAHER